MSDPLSDWISWRSLSRAAVLERLGAPASAVESGLSYGPTTGLDVVHVPGASPVRVYLQGDHVLLVQLSGDALSALDPDDLARRFPPQAALDSRAGKLFEHQVAANAGLAWSEDGDRVVILEIFEPTTVDDFKARFYTAPGAFIK